jgi:hypothetical protein
MSEVGARPQPPRRGGVAVPWSAASAALQPTRSNRPARHRIAPRDDPLGGHLWDFHGPGLTGRPRRRHAPHCDVPDKGSLGSCGFPARTLNLVRRHPPSVSFVCMSLISVPSMPAGRVGGGPRQQRLGDRARGVHEVAAVQGRNPSTQCQGSHHRREIGITHQPRQLRRADRLAMRSRVPARPGSESASALIRPRV